MRSLRELLGRTSAAEIALPEPVVSRSWNTLSTLGAGSVADIDSSGAVYPRNRPVSVEVWFGVGDRWMRGGRSDGVRQTRIVGLPIIETRQRVGEDDLVQTAWADEPGDGHGRVVIHLANETDVAVVAAIVVRPNGLLKGGRIDELRVSGSMIVADKVPLVEIGRTPGDSATAREVDPEHPALLDALASASEELLGQSEISDPDGRASIAALIPLTPGVDREIQVLDGREATTVAPAPIENVVAGWRAHVTEAAEFVLPAWPKHIPISLQTSLLGAVADRGAPLGDEQWRRADDTVLVAALAGVGLSWGAASILDRLLDDVTNGDLGRDDWPAVASACAAVAGTASGDDVLKKNGEAVLAVAGHALSAARTIGLILPLVRVLAAAHGPDAAEDASSIDGVLRNPADGVTYARHGFPVPADSVAFVDEAIAKSAGPMTAEKIGLSMVASAHFDEDFEPLVPVRSLAGSTWRWPHRGCGDSPHARAALLLGLRALCVSEYPGGPAHEPVRLTTPADIDIFPGMSSSWLGQNMQFKRLPTTAGVLSVALRWHGERPALLWELESPTGHPFVLSCSSVDREFATSELTGETLLQAPTHLAPKPDAKPKKSML